MSPLFEERGHEPGCRSEKVCGPCDCAAVSPTSHALYVLRYLTCSNCKWHDASGEGVSIRKGVRLTEMTCFVCGCKTLISTWRTRS